MRVRRTMTFIFISMLCQFANAEALVVIGHENLAATDALTLRRLYTGRAVSIDTQPALPINLPAGHPWRQQFLDLVLGQNEDQYTGYWLVRRYVGKGAPPVEVTDAKELIRYIGSTPGALGYLPASLVPSNSKVIFSSGGGRPEPAGGISSRALKIRFGDVALLTP